MLLGEAIQESSFLERHLRVLGSRLGDEKESKHLPEALSEEIISTANRLRDLQVSIAWTEQQASVGGLPLAAYRVRGKIFLKLAEIFEISNYKESEKYRRLAEQDTSLAEKAVLLVDLQIPRIENKDEPKEET